MHTSQSGNTQHMFTTNHNTPTCLLALTIAKKTILANLEKWENNQHLSMIGSPTQQIPMKQQSALQKIHLKQFSKTSAGVIMPQQCK